MEGSGFLSAAHANASIQAIVIRGISDLVRKKAQSDAAGWQAIASTHAAAFAFQLLSDLSVNERPAKSRRSKGKRSDSIDRLPSAMPEDGITLSGNDEKL